PTRRSSDLDRGDRRTLKAGQENPAQRVAERQAIAPLERLGHESRLALLVAAGLDVERAGLLQFLPVLHIDGHGLPLKVSLNGTAAERWVRRGRCETWRPCKAAGRIDQTRRRLDGLTPLCGIGVTSRMLVMVKPTAWRARIALSRPEPGPLISTSSVRTPCSAAFLPASSAATWAA